MISVLPASNAQLTASVLIVTSTPLYVTATTSSDSSGQSTVTITTLAQDYHVT